MDFPNEIDPAQEQEAQEEKLQAFGSKLASQRDDWIRARANTGWDKRVRADVDQYNGIDEANKHTVDMMTVAHEGYPITGSQSSQKPTRSTVFIGLTRQKTNTAEARLSDILLPTDEKNWGIKPTPNPTVVKGLNDTNPAMMPDGSPMVDQQTGQPITRKEVAAEISRIAEEKAEAMQREIDDQLVEGDYRGELRKVIHDAAVMGVGILKGPVVTNRFNKSWRKVTDEFGQSVQMIEMVQETKPASFRVDPRNIWEDPACGETVHNGKGIYERTLMTAKQLRDLVKQPGYLKAQISKVLEEGSKHSAAMSDAAADDDRKDQMKEIFEVWEYWGEVDKDDAAAAGMEVDEDDELFSMSACVVMVNATVIKVFPNPMDTEELPYDFYPWEKIPDRTRGYGVPYLMRSQQKIMNAAWRTLMDNAGLSSAPQIVVKPNIIQPADKKWELSGRKIWWCTDPSVDVRQAFSSFEFNSHQAELEGIIKMATQLADEETSVPLMAQGDSRNVPDTVGGMQMLMNSANVVLRRLVKQFDDMITRPHIRRYYDYNMLYGEDEEIKGDFSIDARGSSALLVRDVQNQAFTQMLALATNPAFAPMIDAKKLFEKALQAQQIDPKDIMLTEEEEQRRAEQAAQQPPPAAPQIEAAKIRSQAMLQTAQMQSQADQVEMQTRMQLAEQDRAARIAELQLQREIEMLKLAQTKELTLEQIKAKLGDTAIKERSRKELFNAEAQLKLQTGQGI